MLEDREWLFFEATEQRIKAWTQRDQENRVALATGNPPPYSPEAQLAKRASLIQEMDYAERLEAALHQGDLEPEKQRRLELHQQWLVETAFRTHPEIAAQEEILVKALSQFEPQVQNRPTDWCGIESILREEPDGDLREAAWRATESLAQELESGMAEVFQLREAWAQSLVGTGFASIAYHAQQMDRTQVVNLVDEVERTTRSVMPGIMDQLCAAAKVSDLEPWDYFYGLSQLWSTARSAFEPDSFMDIAELQARRWGWEPSALSLTWKPGNLAGRPQVWGGTKAVTLCGRPAPGPWSCDRFLRAYGNGLHRLLVPESRFFLETPAAVQSEATGALFSHILTDVHWLEEHTGAGSKAIDELIQVIRMSHLLKLRFHLAHNAFENVAYTHAGVEPTRLFQDILEQIFHGTRQQSVVWAVMRSYVETPLSHAIPILGSVMGAQLWEAGAAEDPAVWRSEKVGRMLLKEWIQPGSREPWPQALQRVTKADINLHGFCKWLQLEIFDGPRLEESESVSDAEAEAYFEGIDLSDLDL